MIPLIKNAKDSVGQDASEMETDFLTTTAAISPVLLSNVRTVGSLSSTHTSRYCVHMSINHCMFNRSVLILSKAWDTYTCFLQIF